jgi:prophage DNA circulation protein
MSINIGQDEETIEISVNEYKAVKAVAKGIVEQNQLVLDALKNTTETLKTLIEQLAKRETIVIPPAAVNVKAAEVKIPPPLPAQVTVMEAPDEKRTIDIQVVRDGTGKMTGMTGTIK